MEKYDYSISYKLYGMRYSLRNKKKIIEAYSEKLFKRIIESLDKCFEEGEKFETHEAKPYPLIGVDDVGNTCGLVIFHVISVNFDVYNLAFKEFVS